MNTKQTKTLLTCGLATILVSTGIAFSSVSMAAKDSMPIGNIVNPVIRPGTKPMPDFDIITIQNNYQSGPMAIWRFGKCKSPGRAKVVVKNWGATYNAGTGSQIIVNFEVFKKNGARIFNVTNNLDLLNKGESKEMPFNTGVFPSAGDYTLKATISAKGVREKSTHNNVFSRNISVNQKCP